ncbi:MAG: hypothetical protein BJ554DRAFT_1068 [Olpidium bornovanus]|uniref:Uncharacterized protein n=1 Tax=Olpidium bornovanus TaxID=278681 RepID=A0A8H7ZSP0_9FUNG|nr:MAG: hypothetical protein BJ554DRAFT_1068 [Olpidium bornovanus]
MHAHTHAPSSAGDLFPNQRFPSKKAWKWLTPASRAVVPRPPCRSRSGGGTNPSRSSRFCSVSNN